MGGCVLYRIRPPISMLHHLIANFFPEETIPDLPIVNNPKPTGAYVPPSMRNQPTGAGPRRGRGYGRKNNAPPDIQNKFAFPSLS